MQAMRGAVYGAALQSVLDTIEQLDLQLVQVADPNQVGSFVCPTLRHITSRHIHTHRAVRQSRSGYQLCTARPSPAAAPLVFPGTYLEASCGNSPAAVWCRY